MRREQVLFVVVLALAVLIGGCELLGAYEKSRPPLPSVEAVDAPAMAARSHPADAPWFLTLVGGRAELPPSRGAGDRSMFVPHSDLLPVAAAVLDFPRALDTPWILPPVANGPGVEFYRWFRTDAPPQVAAAEETLPEETETEVVESGEDEELPEDDGGEVVYEGPKQKEFVPAEWDKLHLSGMREPWYGRVSMQEAQRKQGFTKYHLLLPENRTLPFFWENINPKTLRPGSSSVITMESSNVERLEFADDALNRYWTRRTVDRVKAGDGPALKSLGRYMLDLADDPMYVRQDALSLAVEVFQEAVEADARDVEAALLLSEALHRSFRFDEELGLLERRLAERDDPALRARLGRLYEALALPEKADAEYSAALKTAPADVGARLRRAEVRFALGRRAEAATDFEEAERFGSPEEKIRAREGRARVLLATGNPAEAAALLADASDARSLSTRGAALWCERRFAEALDAFARAEQADPEHEIAVTNLGFAQAMTAADAPAVEAAIETLDRARRLDPLNYFWPPLGAGFAEQVRGDRVASVDRYREASLALPDDPYARYALGRSYLRDGRYEDARTEFRAALERDYRFVDALFGAGSASLELGDFAAARGELGRAAELFRRDLEAANASRKADRVTAAKRMLLLGLYRLGRTWLLSTDVPEKVRLEEAGKAFEAALAIDEGFLPALNAMGYVHHLTGDSEQARQRFDRARTLAPRDGVSPDAAYAEDANRRITDSLMRKLWTDSFDRSGPGVGRGWETTPAWSIDPRIVDGSVLMQGRTNEAGVMRVFHDDPAARGRGDARLGDRFIRLRTTVTLDQMGANEFRVLYYLVANTQRPDPTAWVGIGRNSRGNVAAYVKKASERDKGVETEIIGADGQPIRWPSGEVRIGLDRVDHVKGTFTLSLNDEVVHTAEAGLAKRGVARVGFEVRSDLPGEPFTARVGEVVLEIYE